MMREIYIGNFWAKLIAVIILIALAYKGIESLPAISTHIVSLSDE